MLRLGGLEQVGVGCCLGAYKRLSKPTIRSNPTLSVVGVDYFGNVEAPVQNTGTTGN